MSLVNSFDVPQTALVNFFPGSSFDALSSTYGAPQTGTATWEGLMATQSGAATVASYVDTIIRWSVAALIAFAVWEFQGVKTDISDIKKDVLSNNITLLQKLDAMDAKFSVAVAHLNDIKANIKIRP